ncbi:hypothetical protein SAMN05720766_102233 [Fibrobacter sp. UWH9]|uniref:hypothetical protein n=1 Tax=unclassified Fibrobacter TaxID=2634177 RepID=UPI0009240EBC|nr:MULTISPECIES: hypothetical protein [Fibrobacter]MCQ2099365.1 hypothetical protein [Fibrobacter sp.]MCL4101002.1 hypothetical protein [Fibrobacter succinogenes]MDO4947015.1 hypothetical protein [Fibrobacter sp.]OWV06926.1 hypothetical protein B7993_03950 [Fibrobacter sp. UWH3]OWV16191.1 hypothetical protein B7992_03055 [Fibrobacter sp. UWH1]
MDGIIVKMDIRGFIRFPAEAIRTMKLDKMAKQTTGPRGETIDVGPYADIEVDPVGKRVAITPVKEAKATSFRFILGVNGSKSKFLYFKGALNAIGEKIVTGPYILEKEGNKYIFTSKNASSKKKGEWKLIACRNSVANKTMLSIDSRGTIIFDRNSKNAVNTAVNKTMVAEYDKTKKVFSLTFSKDKGFINVRTIASHANASFMGTLSSHGIALPRQSYRTECKIEGKVLSFSVASLVAEQRAAAKANKK